MHSLPSILLRPQVRGFKQSKGGPHVLVRGDGLLVQQPLATVFKLLWDPGAKANYDAQVDKVARVKVMRVLLHARVRLPHASIYASL